MVDISSRKCINILKLAFALFYAFNAEFPIYFVTLIYMITVVCAFDLILVELVFKFQFKKTRKYFEKRTSLSI